MTGVIYGVFRDVRNIQDTLRADQLVWCFDREGSKRRKLYPDYKKKRHNRTLTPKELADEKKFQEQMIKLREDYLPTIGAKNIFHKKGYESDDMMASVCLCISPEDSAVIVTGDADLHQCLSNRVKVFNPNKNQLFTSHDLKVAHGVTPKQWGRVKTIGGCRTDEVTGVPGVAEGTAIKYLLGTLPETSSKFKAIVSKEGRTVRKRNKKLTVLPMKGTPACVPVKESLSVNGWNAVLAKLGFRSMKDKVPLGTGANRNRKTLNKGFNL